jgi:hypothetical protein
MKKALLLSLLLSATLFAECYEPPSVCGEKYQTMNVYNECYVQSENKYNTGYFQSHNKYDDCYVQDKWKYEKGYVQDVYKYEPGFAKDKTIFGFSND